ncbi:MAG: glycosyl transferase [Candidatus Binatia bacterium]|nr:MAG: glycosyl transferase [Candidatus Binatia bacterium]
MSTAICLVTWNGGTMAAAALQSAARQDLRDLFLVVVDNASSDADREILRSRVEGDHRVAFLWNEHNVGFARAANQALETAFSRGADWAVLLTQDTLLPPDACRRLVEVARTIPHLAVAGPAVADQMTGKLLSVGERTEPWLFALPRSLVRYRRVRLPYRDVEGVVGCCMLLSRAAWTHVRGFREDLFAYYEEVDLCLRARRAGYRVVLIPSVQVSHAGWRGFGGGLTPLSARLKARNLILLARAHVRGWQWAIVGPSVAALFTASALWYCGRGRRAVVWSLVQGVLDGLRGASGPICGRVLDRSRCALP